MKNPFNHNKVEAKLALEKFAMTTIAYYINSMLEDWRLDVPVWKSKNRENWHIYLDSLIDKYNITYEQLQENRVYLDNIKSTWENEND